MLVRKHVDQNGSVAKRSVGVAPEVNMGNHCTQATKHASNRTPNRPHQKSKTGVLQLIFSKKKVKDRTQLAFPVSVPVILESVRLE